MNLVVVGDSSWQLTHDGFGIWSRTNTDIVALDRVNEGFSHSVALWTFERRRPRYDRLKVVLELPSNEAMRMAVGAGAGASVISRLVAEPSLRAGNLKVIAFELPERAFTALRHRERYFSKAARALLNEIRGSRSPTR